MRRSFDFSELERALADAAFRWTDRDKALWRAYVREKQAEDEQ